jgi:ubiquinone/menaquinone biosynthesis C-methylase UbiE
MSATELDFPEASFDFILCVEAAFRFNTREEFLYEAKRVLKPRGRLVLSDIIFKSREIEGSSNYRTANNFVNNLAEYRALYEKIGFENIRIHDATDQCWKQFYKYCRQLVWRKFATGEIDHWTRNRLMLALSYGSAAIKQYLLVSAQRSA